MRISPRRILLPAVLGAALALGCRTAPPPRSPATPTSASAPDKRPTPPPGPDLSSPQAVTKAWVAAVSAGNWTALVPLVQPAAQARARAGIGAATPAEWAKLQTTARKLSDAMAAKQPDFVRVEAILAEPTHHEWYFCGRKPQGIYWQGPCTFSVIEVDGRWYFLDVRDEPDSD